MKKQVDKLSSENRELKEKVSENLIHSLRTNDEALSFIK